jgi:5-methyltetrahydrofolate--homocysteine methyltransferase
LEGIHLEYLQAGANLIETDTFGASPLRLKEFDFSKFDSSDLKAIPESLDLKTCSLESLTLQLNIEGCRIAQRAVEKYRTQPDYDGRPLFVAGSIVVRLSPVFFNGPLSNATTLNIKLQG